MPQINTNLNIEISYDSWLGILFWGFNLLSIKSKYL